jgi:Flp pilus assembly protein TadG
MLKIKTSIKGLARNEDGGVLIPFGLTLTLAITCVGGAIDFGRAAKVQAKLQTTLDTAVLAGMKQNNGQRISAASSYFQSDWQTSGQAAATPTFTKTGNTVLNAVASVSVPTPFLSIAGLSTISVTAASTAKVTATSVTAQPCAIVLDQSADNAFQLISPSAVPASTCEVSVHSTSDRAVNLHSPETTAFKSICARGRAWDYQSGTKSWSSLLNLQTDCNTPLADPLAGTMPVVTAGACTSANTNKTITTATINPGTFCGNTVFGTTTTTTTLAAGLYIISGGTLTVSAKILKGHADGVTFYLADDAAKLVYSAKEDNNNSSNVFLRAPTTGTYKDLLVFEAPNLSTPSSTSTYRMQILSADKQRWAGIIYLPSSNMNINSTSDWHACDCTMIVNTLKTDSMSKFPWNPYKTFTIEGQTTTALRLTQ